MNVGEVKSLCVKHFLVPFEGTGKMDKQGNFLAYLCPAGVPTIAYGITFDEYNNPIKLGAVWSQERARKHESTILDTFLAGLLKASPALITEPSARVSAILSWVYNLGLSNYNKSTFKKKIDSKDWINSAIECRKWTRAGGKILNGLVKRREKESLVILLGSFEA